MKKKLISLLSVSALMLVACEEETQTEEQATTEAPTTEETSSEEVSEVETNEEDTDDEEETSDDNVQTFNEQVADNEYVTAELVEIGQYYDEEWDEHLIEVVFEVVNNSDEEIEVQANGVSINDRMVDESIIFMSQSIESGKSARTVLELQDYDGNNLPDLENNFEMDLHVWGWETDFTQDYPVSVELQ